jgi:hypothetical protein
VSIRAYKGQQLLSDNTIQLRVKKRAVDDRKTRNAIFGLAKKHAAEQGWVNGAMGESYGIVSVEQV